ncbi:MAG: chemotaxis protein CheB [Thermodesulfobacteriota bacterium]
MTREKERPNQEQPDSQGKEPSQDAVQKAAKDETKSPKDFPVVGLGASAGGLEALKAFFSQAPLETGMAYIVVMHLAPNQPTMLPELLQKITDVPVSLTEDGQSLRPDHIYVVPPKKEVSVYNGIIQLLNPVDKDFSLPIDFFFRSLAADRDSRAAAVILSGTGTDGTVGLREIKDYEGLVLVQDPETAKYDGMPRSAMGTGLVDMALAPEKMVQKLSDYFKQPVQTRVKKPEAFEDKDWLHKIFALLRVQAGQDFSFYKRNTILRRIGRRMVLNQINDYETYLSFLRKDTKEVNALFQELLIGVTNFFRDPKSYETLKQEILPQVFADLKDDTAFRVWVPGCSTGEEVYSLAMVILETLDDFPSKRVSLQMFGTDIDKRAIDKAREGLYPSSIRADVSQKRLSRFFSSEGEAYRIRKDVRDAVVFSVQNVLRDPPFSRLNLLCCRNLLIYLNTEAQKKLLPLFHYTLVPGGVMMLGSSETIGSFTFLFEPLSTTWKIYKRNEAPESMLHRIEFPTGRQQNTTNESPASAETPQPSPANLEKATKDLILDRFAPVGVLIDSKGTILNIQGRSGKYLEPASGPPTQNILDMAREGLRMELSMAIRKAWSSGESITRHHVRVQNNGGTQAIDLHVLPLEKPKELKGRLLVIFEDIEPPAEEGASSPPRPWSSREYGDESRIAELEQELQETRESHQATVEELESANEELKSTNEELQSTNEELESSKEELQSLNEEMQTVNSELQSKVDELSEAHDDITNLLNSTQIATLFVDNEIKVKRFSREVTKIINLIDSDIGRPLSDQSTRIEGVDLTGHIRQVLEKLTPVEKEIQNSDSTWYVMRVMPYRTREDQIKGAVVTFRNIDAQKKTQEKLKEANSEMEQAWHLTRRAFDMNPSPLAVLDDQARVVIANTALCRLFDISMEKVEGLDVFSLDSLKDKDTDLQARLGEAMEGNQDFETRPFQLDTGKGQKSYAIQGSVVGQEEGKRPYRILLHFKDNF